MADRFGGVRTLSVVYGLAALGLGAVSFHQASHWGALALMMFTMLALGAGNGAVFQLAPQRFGKEIGVVTGLVGMTGGAGGFYLASSLGWAKQVTGSYQAGLMGFAFLAVIALVGLTGVKARWRKTWPELAGAAAGGLRL
jgi:NNP family nitrate/nitrite transporter-like MFS transporter